MRLSIQSLSRDRILKHAVRLCSTGVVIAFSWAMAACSQSSRLPGGPSPAPPVVPLELTRAFPPAGSSAGGAAVEISGAGFMPGMVVEFDGIRVSWRANATDGPITTFYTEAPPHAAGAIDIVVTNPDGRSRRLSSGYTYAEQGTFDPNGAWSGVTMGGTDTLVDFVIRDNKLIAASCQHSVLAAFPISESPAVEGGEFSVNRDDDAKLSGKMVSAAEMVGTISFAPCTIEPLTWRAVRVPDSPPDRGRQ
jgi:hypothetical protein